MERSVDYVKAFITSYKFNSCCYLATVRIGVLIIGYYNMCASMLSVIATANQSFPPLFMKILEAISEDDPSVSLCVLAYATEFGFSVLLVSAMHRNEMMLLRVYMYYTMAVTVIALLIYSMVIANIDVLIKIAMVINIVYQCYVILLVRSAIVEIKENGKLNGGISIDLTTISMKPVSDVETPPEKKVEIFAKVGQRQEELKTDKEIKQAQAEKKTEEIKKDQANDNKGAEVATITTTAVTDTVEVAKKKGKESKKKDSVKQKEDGEKSKEIIKKDEVKKKEDGEKAKEIIKKDETKKSFFFSRKESSKSKELKKDTDANLETVEEVSKK